MCCVCSGCPLVEQVWIYGNSYESFLVAVVVPDEKEFVPFAKSNQLDGSFEELCKNPKVRFLRYPKNPSMEAALCVLAGQIGPGILAAPQQSFACSCNLQMENFAGFMGGFSVELGCDSAAGCMQSKLRLSAGNKDLAETLQNEPSEPRSCGCRLLRW